MIAWLLVFGKKLGILTMLCACSWVMWIVLCYVVAPGRGECGYITREGHKISFSRFGLDIVYVSDVGRPGDLLFLTGPYIWNGNFQSCVWMGLVDANSAAKYNKIYLSNKYVWIFFFMAVAYRALSPITCCRKRRSDTCSECGYALSCSQVRCPECGWLVGQQ